MCSCSRLGSSDNHYMYWCTISFFLLRVSGSDRLQAFSFKFTLVHVRWIINRQCCDFFYCAVQADTHNARTFTTINARTQTLPLCTTGDVFYAECLLSGTQQRASLPRAALGKLWHSAKSALPRAGHSAKKCTRHSAKTPSSDGNHPTVTLCRVPTVRHSTKFFFNYFAEC
jgi:hypothetical protein